MVDTSFLECTEFCSLKPATVVGYPLYGFNHQGCVIGTPADPGTLACPLECTRPTQADRGTNAVFTGNLPFTPGPAMSKRFTLSGQDVRFITIRRVQNQAACVANFEGLAFQVYGPSDGGALAPGVFPIASSSTSTDNVAGVMLELAFATGGSVTLTSLTPVTGTFSILGFTQDAGGPLQGSFTATTCP